MVNTDLILKFNNTTKDPLLIVIDPPCIDYKLEPGQSLKLKIVDYRSCDDDVSNIIDVRYPGERYSAGYAIGKSDFQNILAKLARDPKTGKITEKIQIYTHSRGAAFGVGYTEALLEMIKANAGEFANPSNVIDFALNIAPHQSTFIESSVDESYSMHHDADGLSGNEMRGLKGAFSSNIGKKTIEAHSTASFTKEVNGFLQSWQSNKGDSKKTIDDFVRRMQNQYGITVTVN